MSKWRPDRSRHETHFKLFLDVKEAQSFGIGVAKSGKSCFGGTSGWFIPSSPKGMLSQGQTSS
jgi:hypothetical protein